MSRDKVQIIVKGKDKTDNIRAWSIKGNKVDITFSNGKTYSYNANNVEIKHSALSNNSASNCFEYLKCIARVVGLHDPRVGNILSNRYEKIDFIDPDSMLCAFLTGKIQDKNKKNTSVVIFPFGFNMSQKAAVDNALTHPLSIIEGPPGTGKTQTILNILANAVMRDESVAVVSSNNSATKNVQDKLKKYEVDFIAAYLGNSDNKKDFIESQKSLPDLTDWILSAGQEYDKKEKLHILYDSLCEMLMKKNELSQLRRELDAIELEHKHFCEYCDFTDETVSLYLKPSSSDIALELWLECEKYVKRGKMPGFIGRLIDSFLLGVINKDFYSVSPDEMIGICQKRWYTAKIKELSSSISLFQTELNRFDFAQKMKEYSILSAKLFRNKLAKKYQKTSRHQFELDDLWKKSSTFINEYPIVLATTYSLRSSLSHKVMYDYVIIDEASQVDIATGALALSCAKKAVIVGDLKQLPNVVDSDAAKQTDAVFSDFHLRETYRYKNHSLLSAVLELFPKAPRVLLREHYRCHPKIIEFCNQKFYDNQLIVLTESKTKRQPLIVYKTSPGNHDREHVNQRQIDVIKNEIIPKQHLNDGKSSVGIVTPYRKQTNALQEAFAGTGIQADTVDKFQGRENDVIILSTVDNEISKFTDNANRLNVAVSRAIDQLIVVINDGNDAGDSNIGDLVRYIQYNNMEVIQSEVYSIFDYLYKNYNDKRKLFLHKHGRISEYDSENLMNVLIRDILKDERFSKFDISLHVPLKMIIRDTEKLDEKEKLYVQNILTHVDFLIFDKLGKIPKLVVEVDGVSFHQVGTRQAERDQMKNRILEKYGIPFIRFRTNESGERERLVSKLNSVIGC